MIFNKKFAQVLGLNVMLGLSIACPTAFAETASTTATTTVSTTKKVNLSHIFITLSDAMSAVKTGDITKAKTDLTKIQSDFNAILQGLDNKNSALGQKASQAIATALANPTSDTLSQISSDLYAFEKEQNPVDYTAQRQAFTKKMLPAYDKFNQVVQTATPEKVEELRKAYSEFNAVWVGNERVVRSTVDELGKTTEASRKR